LGDRLTNYPKYDAAEQSDLSRSPSAARFNCLIEALLILSQHGLHA